MSHTHRINFFYYDRIIAAANVHVDGRNEARFVSSSSYAVVHMEVKKVVENKTEVSHHINHALIFFFLSEKIHEIDAVYKNIQETKRGIAVPISRLHQIKIITVSP